MKTVQLAVVAAAALFLFTTRKASAATVGRLTTANIQPPKLNSYTQSPSVAAQYASYGYGAALARQATAQQQANPVSQLASLASSLFSKVTSGSSNMPSAPTYFPGEVNTSAPGYVPTYTPDTTGEAAAIDYYAQHADSFLVDTPTSFNTDPSAYLDVGGIDAL